MDDLVIALGPVIVCSLALQQFLELVDPLLARFLRRHRKWLLRVVALVIALLLTFGLRLRLLEALGVPPSDVLDGLVTALFLVGGTKSINDLLKWVGYRKIAARRALAEAEAGAA